MARTIHVHVSIEWLLRAERFGGFANSFRDSAGRPIPLNRVRKLLTDLLDSGVKVLPIGEPCDGFDDVTGCPGHERPEDMPPRKQIELMAALLKRKNEGELL